MPSSVLADDRVVSLHSSMEMHRRYILSSSFVTRSTASGPIVRHVSTGSGTSRSYTFNNGSGFMTCRLIHVMTVCDKQNLLLTRLVDFSVTAYIVTVPPVTPHPKHPRRLVQCRLAACSRAVVAFLLYEQAAQHPRAPQWYIAQ